MEPVEGAGLPPLLPHQKYKDAERHENLRVGGVCLLKYDNKVKATYRLCIIREIFHSEEGVVRTVTVGYRPNKLCGGGKYYKPTPLKVIPVGIQRLALICPAEQLNVKTDNENLEDESEPADLKSLATEASSAEVNLNFAKVILEEEAATKKASKEEVDNKEASEEEVDIEEASEEMVTEDVFADVSTRDFTDDSAE